MNAKNGALDTRILTKEISAPFFSKTAGKNSLDNADAVIHVIHGAINLRPVRNAG